MILKEWGYKDLAYSMKYKSEGITNFRIYQYGILYITVI